VVVFFPVCLPGSSFGASHEHTNYTTDKQDSAKSKPGICAGRVRAAYQEIHPNGKTNNAKSDDNIGNDRILHGNSYLPLLDERLVDDDRSKKYLPWPFQSVSIVSNV
jgi:hypothetical protein